MPTSRLLAVNRVAVDVASGWLCGVRRVCSPNADDRPCLPELIVLHNISLPPGEFGGPWIDRLFLNRLDPAAHPYFREVADLAVSSHLLIRRDGETVQYVPFHRRAWHAGASSYCGRERCNDFAIGIELEGTDDAPYTDAQYAALGEVVGTLVNAYPSLSMQRIVGHSDVSPGRKTDPGPAFDWARLHRLLEDA